MDDIKTDNQVDGTPVSSKIKVKKNASKFPIKTYSMKSSPRGNMLIVSNEEFEDDGDCRDGADVDYTNIKSLFEQLGFKIIPHRNLGYWDMRDKIREFAKLEDHQNVDMAVVCVLSHGDEESIKSADGNSVEREWIIEQFNNANSRILDGKPKLLIFQSCYGDVVDHGVNEHEDKDAKADADGTDARPTFEDMVIVHATVPGYCTWRDPNDGSWLIQSICKVFANYATGDDLLTLLRIVAHEISEKEDNEGGTIKQGIAVETRHFYKNLYFNPEEETTISEEKITTPEHNIPESPRTTRRIGGRWWSRGSGASEPQGAIMPVDKDAEFYNMSYRRRGKAFIFNHMNFDSRLSLNTRNGTNNDRDNLRVTLRQLDFDVEVYNDLPFKEIDRILENASMDDHSDADCILVAVMSHGELGILYSSDQPYTPDRLCNHFTADKCRTLAGKPKIFVLQACRGDQLDSGVKMVNRRRIQSDKGAQTYKIPTHADFLIAYSTIPGFYSWRNTTAGSWFIQAFCYVLQRNGFSEDLLSMFTLASRRVAFDFQSNVPGDFIMHEKKQIPCITSMLTRKILFTKKN